MYYILLYIIIYYIYIYIYIFHIYIYIYIFIYIYIYYICIYKEGRLLHNITDDVNKFLAFTYIN